MKRMPERKSRFVLVVAASAVAFVPACAQAPPPKTVTVEKRDLGFVPADVAARVGDTLQWVNKDLFDHTGTARDGSFDVAVDTDKSGSVVLKSAGTFEYYCRLHPNMVGKVVVAK